MIWPRTGKKIRQMNILRDVIDINGDNRVSEAKKLLLLLGHTMICGQKLFQLRNQSFEI